VLNKYEDKTLRFTPLLVLLHYQGPKLTLGKCQMSVKKWFWRGL